MTIRNTLLGLGLILATGSAFALPPLPPLPPSPSAVAHRIQSDTDHLIGRADSRDRDSRHDRDEAREHDRDHDGDRDGDHGWHRGYGHHHRHHHGCAHRSRHGDCTRW